MVLNTMEGGIMQARSRGALAPFDAAVRQLRLYFDYLQRDAAATRLPAEFPADKPPAEPQSAEPELGRNT